MDRIADLEAQVDRLKTEAFNKGLGMMEAMTECERLRAELTALQLRHADLLIGRQRSV